MCVIAFFGVLIAAVSLLAFLAAGGECSICIDHLLYSDGLSVTDRRLGPRMGSDHFPLIVDLALVG